MKRNFRTVVAAVLSALVAGAILPLPATAHHGGTHFERHFAFDVNIPLTKVTVGPIAHVCVDTGDGEGPTCTPKEIVVGGGNLASYTVLVDAVGQTAAPAEGTLTDCVAGDPESGKSLTVEALGTGFQNVHVEIIDNLTGDTVFEHDTGQILGRRVTFTTSLCAEDA